MATSEITTRQKKFAEQIKRSLATIIFSEQFLLRNFTGMCSISRVTVSADLQIAHVFWDIETQHQEAVFEILEEEKKNLRHLLGKAVGFKFTPDLNFKIDKNIETAQKVDNALANPNLYRNFEDTVR